jgi:hypothetical protein
MTSATNEWLKLKLLDLGTSLWLRKARLSKPRRRNRCSSRG